MGKDGDKSTDTSETKPPSQPTDEDRTKMEERKLREHSVQRSLTHIGDASPLLPDGSNYLVWGELMKDLYEEDQNWELVRGTEKRPGTAGTEQTDWDARNSRGLRFLRRSVDVSHIPSLLSLSATEAWEQLKATFDLDPTHTNLSITRTLETLSANSTEEVPSLVQDAETILARARATSHPLSPRTTLDSDSPATKAANRQHNLLFSHHILNALPVDDPEWVTFSVLYRNNETHDFHPRHLLNKINAKILERQVRTISINSSPVLPRRNDSRALLLGGGTYPSRNPSRNPQTPTPRQNTPFSSSNPRPPCPHCAQQSPTHSPLRCWDNPAGTNFRDSNVGGGGGSGRDGGGGGGGKGGKGGRKGGSGGGTGGGGSTVSVVIGGSDTLLATTSGGTAANEKDDNLYLDSCAAKHTVHDRSLFVKFRSSTGTAEGFNGDIVHVEGSGDITFKVNVGGIVKEITVLNVSFCPKSKFNLVSLPSLQKAGVSASFDKDGTFKAEYGGQVVLAGRNHPRLDIAQIFSPRRCNVIGAVIASKDKRIVIVEHAHRLLGHPGQGAMRDLLKLDDPLLKRTTNEDLKEFFAETCRPCKEGKDHRTPFPTSTRVTEQPLSLLHSDLAGPMDPSWSGCRYYVTLVDEATDFVCARALKKKTEVVGAIKEMFLEMKVKFEGFHKPDDNLITTTVLRTDNGTEYAATEFQEWLKNNNITRETSIDYTPEQNGKAERTNRTLKEKVRCKLSDAGLSPKYWAEALSSSVHSINRLPSASLQFDTPYHAFTGHHDPDLLSLPRFGQHVWVHVPDSRTFEPNSEECIFLSLGLEQGKKAARVQRIGAPGGTGIYWTRNFEMKKERIVRRRRSDEDDELLENGGDEEFDGKPEDEQGDGGAGVAEESEGVNDGRQAPAGPQASPTVVEEPEGPAGTQKKKKTHSWSYELRPPETETESALGSKWGAVGGGEGRTRRSKEQPEPTNALTFIDDVTPSTPSSPSLNPTLLVRKGATVLDLKGRPRPVVPHSYAEAMSSPYRDEWYLSMKGEIGSLQRRPAWKLVDEPKGAFILGGKWAYDVKFDTDDQPTRLKARFCVKGLKNLPYFERFGPCSAPLVPFPSSLVFFVLVTGKRLVVKVSDFVQGFAQASITHTTDEPVYMEQPQGFVDPERPHHVCQLIQSLYGLPHSTRAFDQEVRSKLKSGGFITIADNVSLYVKFDEVTGKLTYFLNYVDDGLTAGEEEEVDVFLGDLHEKFDIEVRGGLDGAVYLGREVKYDRISGTIIITQVSQIEKTVKELNIKVRPTHSPMQKGVVYSKYDGQASPATIEWYLKGVGHLQYIVSSRPDAAFPTGILSRHASNPGAEHVKLLERVVSYLSTTKHVGLQIGGTRENSEDVVGYVDADYAGDRMDSKSTTGFAIFLNDSLVDFSSKKQGNIATSTPQAESIATYMALQESEWVHCIASTLNIVDQDSPIVLFNDNSTSVGNFNNETYLESVKNVDTKVRHVRQQVEAGIVVIKWVKSTDNIADLLTKPLAPKEHRRLSEMIGLVGFPTKEEVGAWGSR